MKTLEELIRETERNLDLIARTSLLGKERTKKITAAQQLFAELVKDLDSNEAIIVW
jgi:hypothetical protein